MKKYIFYGVSKLFLVFALFLWIGSNSEILGEEAQTPSAPAEDEGGATFAELTHVLFLVQSFNSNNPENWKGAIGQVIAGPRGSSEESQAASAQSTAQDIAAAQEQEINRIRQQREALEELQGRLQNLVNQYSNSGGNVGPGWTRSWDGARADWQKIIGKSLPRPGGAGGGAPGGGGTDQGAGGHGPSTATGEPPSGPTEEGGSCGGGTEEVDTGPVSVSGPPPRPTNLED